MNGLFQQFPPVGMPDMSTMYPQGRPQPQVPSMPNGQPPMPAPNGGMQLASSQSSPEEIDAMNALAEQQQKPKYSVGVPEIDKYINMFLS